MRTDIIVDSAKQRLLTSRDWLTQSRQPADCYHVGLSLAIIGGLIAWLSDTRAVLMAVLWTSGTILVSGFCWEVIRILRSLLKGATTSTILLGIPSSALVFSISIVVAEQLINEATFISPEYFRNSTNIIASLAVPFVLAFFFAIGLIIYNIHWSVVAALKSLIRNILSPFTNHPAGKPSEKPVVELGRMIAAPLLALSIFYVIGNINRTDSGLQFFVRHVVAVADHHPNVHCVDGLLGERYLLIGEDLLSVSSSKDGKISFSVRTCSPP